MYKKLIAMIMVCAMLVSISPAVAAEDAPAKPTVEEILNEYHQKSFAAQDAQETSTASAYSRGTSGSGQTLEQEAVEQLTEAGYEAYHVTQENYDALESSLMCDFSDLGLDPSGSYIIVISGEESGDGENSSSTPAPRDLTLPPHLWDGPPSGGDGDWFTYDYNNTTYYMRYVTVTPTENSNLHQVLANPVQLLEGYSDDEKLIALNNSLSVLSLVPEVSTVATILSLLMSALPNADITQPVSLTYTPTSIWNITYTQVYDSQDQEWQRSTGVEYVKPKYYLDYYYYDPSTGSSERITTEGFLPNIYSEHYYDTEYMKQYAVLAFEYNTCSMDAVEEVIYKYNGAVVARHERWWETLGYEPA